MGYPVYKLLRAVNRQYPNNGFINYVDVNEDMPNENGEKHIIDEDLRDLINEALNETYIHIAKDEVFTFPTVPGQREYVLPTDCDLRDIQEVVRRGIRPPRPSQCGCYPPPYREAGYFDDETDQ
jgi:disulfide oxidoreductase YuzD